MWYVSRHFILESVKETCYFKFRVKLLLYVPRFRDEAFFKSLKVHVISRGDLTVEFCSSQERDEEKMLCELDVTLPPPSNDPDVSDICFEDHISSTFSQKVTVWKQHERRSIGIWKLVIC